MFGIPGITFLERDSAEAQVEKTYLERLWIKDALLRFLLSVRVVDA